MDMLCRLKNYSSTHRRKKSYHTWPIRMVQNYPATVASAKSKHDWLVAAYFFIKSFSQVHCSLPQYLSVDLERCQKRALRTIFPNKEYD